MSLENDFLPFATSGGANVEPPATWSTDPSRLTGFVEGPAPSVKFNTALRQSSEIAALVGQFIATWSGQPALDNGNINQLEANFVAGLEAVIAPFALQFSLVDTGAQNNIVATFSPGSPSIPITAGQAFLFIPAFSNTGPATLSPNGQGPFALVNTNGSALGSGQYSAGGFCLAIYNGTVMQLLFSQSGAVAGAVGETMVFPAGLNATLQGDLIEVGGPGTLAYTAAVADYAGVYSTKTFLQSTPYSGSTAGTPGLARWPIIQDVRGFLYTLSSVSGGATAQIQQSSPTGVSQGTLQLGSDTSGLLYAPKLLKLANGNMVALYGLASGSLRYAVFDTALNTIKAETVIATAFNVSNTFYFDAVSLTTGGFAVVYQASAATAVQVVTYTSAGVLSIAATTVQALSGTNSLAFLRVTQLTTSGNPVLAIAMRTLMFYGSGGSGTLGTAFVTATIGTSTITIGTTGTVDNTATFGFCALSQSTSGFFAVMTPNGTNLIVTVWTNAGVSSVSASYPYTITSSSYMNFKLLNDGAKFWALWADATSGVNFASVPYTGSASSSVNLGSGTGGSGWSLDAEICNGVFAVFLASTGTGGQFYALFGLPNPYLGISSPYLLQTWTAIGSPSSASGTFWPRLFHAGDWTIITLYEQVTNGEVLWQIGKVVASSLEGVSVNSNPANNPGDAITTIVGVGSFPCNLMKGTEGINFDHNYATPAGNQLSIYPNGVVLQGIIAQVNAQIVLCNPYNGINLNDLVIIGTDNYAYSTKMTDYCTTAPTGPVVAPTQVTGFSCGPNTNSPLASCVNLNGETIVVAVPNTSNQGLALYRYSSSGVLRNFLLLDVTTAVYHDIHIDILTNGNIVLTATDASPLLHTWIATYTLSSIIINTISNTGPWPAGESIHVAQHMMRAHPSGGFFIVYQGTASSQSRFVVFNNAGGIAFGPISLSAWTGTVGNVWHNAQILSNGNIVFSYLSAYTTTIGHYISVLSLGGTVILGPTLVRASCVPGSTAFPPDIAIHPGGFFGTCAWDSTSHQHFSWIWSNLGVLQGTPFSVSTGTTVVLIRPKIICDGIGFWHHYDIGTGQQTFLANIPITGGGNALTPWSAFAWGGAFNVYHDCFYENGRLVFVAGGQVTSGPTYGVSYAVWNTVNYNMEVALTSVAVPTAQPFWPRCWTGGDFCFQHCYALSASNGHFYGVVKWFNSAILGVSRASVGPNEYCPISTAPGTYNVNIAPTPIPGPANPIPVPVFPSGPGCAPAPSFYSNQFFDCQRTNVLFSPYKFGLFGSCVKQFDHTNFGSPGPLTVFGCRGTLAGGSFCNFGLQPLAQ